jgi:chromate transporter
MKGNGTGQWRLLVKIFWSFFKIGPITFGGGYAMIPVFHKEVVESREWLEEEDVADIFAIAQSAPGAVGINSSTFVGYKIAGVPGAIAALIGILLPTFLIVLLLSVFFLTVKEHEKVKAAFEGIRPAVVALIVYAGIRVGRTAVRDVTGLLLAGGSLAFLLITGVNPVFVIALGMVLGIVITALKTRWSGEDMFKAHETQQQNIEDYYFGDGI